MLRGLTTITQGGWGVQSLCLLGIAGEIYHYPLFGTPLVPPCHLHDTDCPSVMLFAMPDSQQSSFGRGSIERL